MYLRFCLEEFLYHTSDPALVALEIRYKDLYANFVDSYAVST